MKSLFDQLKQCSQVKAKYAELEEPQSKRRKIDIVCQNCTEQVSPQSIGPILGACYDIVISLVFSRTQPAQDRLKVLSE